MDEGCARRFGSSTGGSSTGGSPCWGGRSGPALRALTPRPPTLPHGLIVPLLYCHLNAFSLLSEVAGSYHHRASLGEKSGGRPRTKNIFRIIIKPCFWHEYCSMITTRRCEYRGDVMRTRPQPCLCSKAHALATGAPLVYHAFASAEHPFDVARRNFRRVSC